jgi:hypothetical protein
MTISATPNIAMPAAPPRLCPSRAARHRTHQDASDRREADDAEQHTHESDVEPHRRGTRG